MREAFADHREAGLTIEPDTESMAGVAPDALLPEPGARLDGPGFEQWLTGKDAAALAL